MVWVPLLHAVLSELPSRASAVSGPTFALATPESPCAVWQVPSSEMLPFDVSASALIPPGPPRWTPRTSWLLVDELLVDDECCASSVRQTWPPLPSQSWSRPSWIGWNGPSFDSPGLLVTWRIGWPNR